MALASHAELVRSGTLEFVKPRLEASRNRISDGKPRALHTGASRRTYRKRKYPGSHGYSVPTIMRGRAKPRPRRTTRYKIPSATFAVSSLIACTFASRFMIQLRSAPQYARTRSPGQIAFAHAEAPTTEWALAATPILRSDKREAWKRVVALNCFSSSLAV
jgi:hypothetical protein